MCLTELRISFTSILCFLHYIYATLYCIIFTEFMGVVIAQSV
jgi:hypothetical protein